MDTPPEEPPAVEAPLPDDETAAEAAPEGEAPPGEVPPDGEVVEEIIVVRPRPITAASALTASAQDVADRPLTRPGDVAELMPGLFAVQHAGGGKANQYFVRGFDADHGTDAALAIDGVPVNMVSHAHGQGYADLHYLIPETVASVDVRKGPYEVFDGDLATAGAIDLHLVDRIDESSLSATWGSFGTWRGLALLGADPGPTHAVAAIEAYGTNGPFDNPERLTRYNAYAKLTAPLGDAATVSVAGSAYGSGWNASGQIPLRAVESGDLSWWGSEDPTDGGQSTRRQLWATFGTGNERSVLTARGWVGTYDLSMYSNFTFFAGDPVRGDQIEQRDRRTFGGYDVAWTTRLAAGPLRFTTRLGAQGRADAVHTGLFRTEARERLGTTVDAAVREARNGALLREEIGFGRWARLIVGARFDHVTFGVDDALDAPGDGVASSGVAQASLLSPKANLVVMPFDGLDLFANWGTGFHSNDARGATRSVDPVDPLTRAMGYEVGARLHHPRWGQVAMAAWALGLEAETVWVGDEGTTELRGATHRQGLDGMIRATPLTWLHADLDVTLASAVYTSNAGNGSAVALAPTFTLAGGFGVDHPLGVTGGARLRHIGARPATEDGALVAEAFTVLDAEVGYRWRFLRVQFQVDNVLGARWKEVQFANASRLPGEYAPVDDIHFTPGWPRAAFVTLTAYR